MQIRTPLRVMAIQGAEDHRGSRGWKDAWQAVLAQGIKRWSSEQTVEYEFVRCDDVFEVARVDVPPLASSLWTILGTDTPRWLNRHRCLNTRLRVAREELRWTAGMLVQWMSDERFRSQARQRVMDLVDRFKPDVICAHSLGSLVAYDALVRVPHTGHRRLTFVSFGSQIGIRRVQRAFPDCRIAPLPVVHWYHLFNRHDDAFTSRLRVCAANFTQIDAPSDLSGLANHAATSYLAHAGMSEHVWREVLEPACLERSRHIFNNSA